jgi:serine phosphatase RsbU (regulator of sigma subunit)
MDMGRQSALCLAFSVVIIALFATSYAVAGITLRQRFWIPSMPLLILENICIALLHNWLPEAPALTHLDAVQLNGFHNRLVLDGVAVVFSVALGYSGFVVVSVTESRRHVRLELDKAALDAELAAAREIQRLMVPEELPPTPGYVIESIYRPAAQVGGDFFQVIPLGGGQTLLVVGDVSGKGLKAAMTVSAIMGSLHDYRAGKPSEVLAHLNRVLFGRVNGFVTCCATHIAADGTMTLANAGNPAPYRNGKEMAVEPGLPLGMIAESNYADTRHQVAPGDRLTFVSDGVVEATNQKGEIYGFERTLAISNQSANAIAEAAAQFGQEDDITVVTVTRESVEVPAIRLR